MEDKNKTSPGGERAENNQLDKESTLVLTPKGMAMLAAYRSGLFGKKDFYECVEAFGPFWEEFSRMLEKDLDNREAMLSEHTKYETDRARDKRSCYGYLVLIPVSTLCIGMILCAFLEAFGLRIFLFALALSFFSAILPVAVKRYLS